MTTSVLITGTSSGIGRATAQHLLQRENLTVYATTRRPEVLADLAELGIRPSALDVTDAESMRSAVHHIEERQGHHVGDSSTCRVRASTAPAKRPICRVRRRFETKFVGLAPLTQLVLLGMRSADGGRIVNIGPIGGRLILPADVSTTRVNTRWKR